MSRRRKKQKKYDPRRQVRRMSRALLGKPPSERVIPSQKEKPPKHKRRELEREMED